MLAAQSEFLKQLNLTPQEALTVADINRAHRKIIIKYGAGLAGHGNGTENADSLLEKIKSANVARDELIKFLAESTRHSPSITGDNIQPYPYRRERSEAYSSFGWDFISEPIPKGESREARYQRLRREVLACGPLEKELIDEMTPYQLIRSSQVTGDILAEMYPDAYREKVFPYCLEQRSNNTRGETNNTYYPLYDDKLIMFLDQEPMLAFVTILKLDENCLSQEVFDKVDSIFRRLLCTPDQFENMGDLPHLKRKKPMISKVHKEHSARPYQMIKKFISHFHIF